MTILNRYRLLTVDIIETTVGTYVVDRDTYKPLNVDLAHITTIDGFRFYSRKKTKW